ncbi:GNAT family N-acetyltransferase [Candidatus Pelagibacter sp.]|nr:GNAT family N-acetyltransferase [Candidatus Pelagibacter sp.]|tara:strand:- start:3339 stop:3854 length:516 start_codon:yes stop_codon:yes gene_type:complete
MITLLSKKTSDLEPIQIKNICKLKNTQWRYTLKSQLTWFKKNNFKTDLHNLMILKNKIIGYTSLRSRYFEHSKKKYKFLLFDSLIILKKYRKKKYSNILMKFNNNIILSKHKIAFLICEKKMINFYKKFDWCKLKKQTYEILDHRTLKIGMVYNRNNLNKAKKKISLNFKK